MKGLDSINIEKPKIDPKIIETWERIMAKIATIKNANSWKTVKDELAKIKISDVLKRVNELIVYILKLVEHNWLASKDFDPSKWFEDIEKILDRTLVLVTDSAKLYTGIITWIKLIKVD